MPPRYGHYIRILHSATDQAMNSALASMDLTAAQGRIMGYVTHRPEPPCPRDIEEAFQLSHPTVSGLLSRLEKKGFIALVPDEKDRRIKRIHVLSKGQALNETMHAAITASEANLTSDFTDGEKELFAQLLQRAIRNVGIQPCSRKHKEETNE